MFQYILMRFILFCVFSFFILFFCVGEQEGPRIKAQNIEKWTNNTYCDHKYFDIFWHNSNYLQWKKNDANWQSLVEKYKPSRVFDFDNVQRCFSSPFWRFVHFTINDNREAEKKSREKHKRIWEWGRRTYVHHCKEDGMWKQILMSRVIQTFLPSFQWFFWYIFSFPV